MKMTSNKDTKKQETTKHSAPQDVEVEIDEYEFDDSSACGCGCKNNKLKY